MSRGPIQRSIFTPLVGAAILLLAVAGCAREVPVVSVRKLPSPEGVRWMLRSFGHTKTPVPSKVFLHLDGGRYEAYDGCNRISGRYQRRRGALRLDPEISTKIACFDHGLSDRVGREMRAVRFYRIDEKGRLLLYPHRGSSPTLIYTAQ